MSAILFDEHRLILSSADAYLAALRAPQRDSARIQQSRATLGSLMMRHRTSEEEHVLGPFLAAGGFEQLPDVLAAVQQIRQEWLGYSQHVRKWTPQAIEADWTAYVDAVENRVSILRKLTPFEEREVYTPILRFLAQATPVQAKAAPVSARTA